MELEGTSYGEKKSCELKVMNLRSSRDNTLLPRIHTTPGPPALCLQSAQTDLQRLAARVARSITTLLAIKSEAVKQIHEFIREFET